ncbi:unnamed protein product, partial [Effrenium voratum]
SNSSMAAPGMRRSMCRRAAVKSRRDVAIGTSLWQTRRTRSTTCALAPAPLVRSSRNV